jgi:plasminogen activator inhibitor 1 RNA-binding protein
MSDDGEFGVITSNKFAFLDEDEDPKPKKKAPKKVEEKPKDQGKHPHDKNSHHHRQQRAGGQGGERSERQPRREGGEEGGRGRGRGRGRGGRGGRGAKREFDRHVPGTGRRDSQKREGSGKYNWGSEGDDGRRGRRDQQNGQETAPETEVATEEVATEEVKPEEGAAVEGDAGADKKEPAAEQEPEEPETRTLEEYYESQKANRPEEDNHVARSVQNDDFADKVGAAVKEEEDDGPEYNIGNGKSKKGKKRNPNKKGLMNIDEFMKQSAPSNQRGDFRGGRGGRGRGGGNRRGGNRKLDMDESNFPKLG